MAMTAKENARRAVRFMGPERLPVLYFNRDLERSDFVLTGAGAAADFHPETHGRSEWGYIWVRHDDTMGQPKCPPLGESWDQYYNYKLPDPDDPTRYTGLYKAVANNPDRYIIAGIGISGFNQYSFLRGFENTMEDLYLEPEKLLRLMGDVVDYESALIRHYIEAGVDCVMFSDDWGTQQSLMIAPEMWREMFLPLYKKQFDLCRAADVDICFHSCGQVMDILPDLVEAGVNILNLNQPDIFPLQKLSDTLRGKACLMCPVDHQTVAIHGTPDEIRRYANELVRLLSNENGGYIAYIEEYHSVGMSGEQYRAICEAFEELRGCKY